MSVRRKGQSKPELKIGILYQEPDSPISLTRSASGVVTFWCKSPVQVWHVGPVTGPNDPNMSVSTVLFEETEGGGMNEITK